MEIRGKENTYRTAEVSTSKYVIQKLVGAEWYNESNEGYFRDEKDAMELIKELVEIEG